MTTYPIHTVYSRDFDATTSTNQQNNVLRGTATSAAAVRARLTDAASHARPTPHR